MDPTSDAEESEEPSDGGNSITNSGINAVEDTESEITVEYVNDPETDEAANTAEVVFLGGCVSSDKKLAKDRDLRFKVEPAAGRVLTTVAHQIGDAASATTITATGGIYTVSKSSFVSGETALSGKIIVTTKAVNYKVSFNGEGSVGGSYEIYPVVEKDENDKTEVLGDVISASTKTDVEYGKSAKFALVLTDNDGVIENKLDSITLNGEAITTTKTSLNKKTDTAEAEKTECFTFTVDPSKAGSLGDTTTDNTEAEVSVKVVAKAKLTVAFDSENANSTVAASDTNTAETFINYSGSGFGTDSTFVEDDKDNLAKFLAFKVTPSGNYKITDITAKASTDANEEGTDVAVTKGTASTDDGSVECTIALSDVGSFSVDTALTISIATALDDTKDGVHTINFKNTAGNAPEHVTILHGASGANEELESSSLTVTGDTYKISVEAATGYELSKGGNDDKDGNDASLKDQQFVTIIENRKYESETETGKYDDAKIYTHKENASEAITLTLADTATGDTNYGTEATDNRKFITTSVDVVIDTNVQKNDGEKIVYFDDQLGAGYKITADGVIHDEEADDEENTWVVPESVDVLSFTVTSVQKPAVTVDDVETEGTAAENVYTFSVPAMALSDDSDNPSEIVITAADELAEKSVKVKVVADDVTVTSEYDGEVNEETLEDEVDGYYTLAVAPEEGSDLTLNFVPKPGVTIDKVSYTMGETTGEAAPDRKGNVALTLTVTDDVTVDVESKSDYRVKLTNANGELETDGDAYVADYTDTNIGIELTKAGVTYNQDLYDVIVKDGAKTAATEATVNGATATIAAIDKTERGKDLTIEVYINKSTKYTTTLKTNAVSDEVTVSRMVNGKDTKVAENAAVEIMPDAALTFTVTPAKGASLSDLDVEILAKDGTALAEASTPIEAVTFEKGTLTVQTKPGAAKDTEVLVSIYNKNEEKAAGVTTYTALKGGKFVLKLTDPLVKTAEIKSVTAVAGSGTNRDVRLNVNVDFKNKKSLPAAPIQGDLYYKVELTAPTGAPAGVTVISGADLVKYVKVDDFANPSTTLTIPLVVSNSADVDGGVADIAEIISTTAKVTLVQSLSNKNLTTETVADTDYVAGPEAAMKDNTLSTKAPVYETKLTVKSVNSATVITGQTDVKVATPVFGKTTAYDSITVQFVDTKTGVRYGSNYRGFTTRVDDTDNSILVSAASYVKVNSSNYKDMLKTFGVKVTAVAPDESYAASAVVKLKVQQGIYDVDVDESKAKLPETIFKETNKAASVKITPLLNDGIKDYKPAKSTVTWEIDRAYGNNSAYAAAALTGSKPLVSVKNGTVSISKDYQVQAEESDNKFTVTIRANDFAGNGADYPDGNGVNTKVTFEITDQKNEIGKLVVLDADGNVKDPASLTAEEFDYWNHEYDDGTDDESKYLYVVALKKGVKDADSYTNSEDFLPVTFKSGNAKALAVNTASGLLTFSKPADKIKITATTVDGGKASKAELVINVKPYKQVGLGIAGVDDSWSGLDETDIHYSGGNNEMYELYPHYSTGDGWNGISDYKNLKITVKGGKFLANKNWAKNRGNYMGYVVVVTDKSGKATITVTDTANKDKATNHKDYTITNDSFTTVKAPSIKLYDPKKVTADTEEITWQVTDKNNDNYAGSYVKLTPDFTVTASNMAYNIVDEKGTILKINENGRFTLVPGYLYGGAYKMVATVGTMVGGEFVAAAKDAKISFSIPVKKLKTTLTVKGSYTLDATGMSYAVIDVKSDYAYEISDAMNVIKKVQDKDDHTNRFTEFFEVNALEDEDGYVYAYTIGLKSGLSAEQIEYITSKDGKDDCTGYITVSNGRGNIDSLYSYYNTKDVQVKISFKANKYSLTGATIFSNGTATTPVTATVSLMNGKVRDYAALVAVDAADDGRFAAATNAISFNDGDIVITSKAAAIEPGKYDVKLIVVPQTSSYVKWDADAQKWIYANDKTENGTVLTDAELMAKAGIPVTAKIDVKAVDTKSIAKAKSLNVTLRTDDEDIIIWSNADNSTSGIDGTGYVQATATTGGYYQVDVPYSIAAAGSDIAADGVKVNLTKNEVDQNKVTVAESTTEDLVKAVKAVTREGEPVIRLQVSKKALVALTNMPSADKPITGYGKKLKVPVEIKYTNGITTTDTLNFNITMPKKAPADFAAVQETITANKAAIEKIQTRLSSSANVELLYLLGDVYTKVSGLIPADTDVKVSYDLNKKHLNDGEDVAESEETDTPDYNGIMNAGKAKVTLTLVDVSKAADNTADVSWTYTLGINSASNDISSACTAIRALDLTYTNETTAASLLAEITADESVKPYLDARKGHLSIKVTSFMKVLATTKAKGSIRAAIQVKDLVTGTSQTAWLTGNIDQLSTLSEAKTAVSELFDSADEVLAFVNNCSGQEAVMKEAILKAANEAAANKDITIAFKADTDTKKGWDYTPAKAAVTSESETVPAEDGSLSFTLVLTKKQADGSRSAEITSAIATIDKANAEKYVSLTDAKAEIAKAVADAPEYTELKALVAAASTANDADAIKTAIEGKLTTEVGNYKGYSWAWAQTAKEEDDFTYTAATQTTKGKLSFQIELTLDGAKDAGLTTGVTETISVTNVEVVDEDDKYQTAEELKAEIEKIGTTAEPIKAATVPADLAAAKNALDAEIAKVNKATQSINVTTENVEEAEGVTATTYTTSPSGEGVTATKGEYKNVKITIGAGEDAIEFTHDFNFAAVTEGDGN